MIHSYSSYNHTSIHSETPTCKSFSKDDARFGRTGLSNLGNTCYMNTAIQCLSHIPCVIDYFVSGRYKQFINIENNSSSKGLVVTVFAELLQKLWLGKDSYVTPSEFKSIVERFATIFQGYSQHDSQEFFITLLDLVHEDLNSISIKPYIEYPVYSSYDIKQSSEMWNIQKQRNNSKIIDWFYGQTVSFIKCSICNEQRIKYEPFSFLTLPLPPEMYQIFINILPGQFSGYESTSYPLSIKLNMRASASMQEVVNEIANACGVSPKQVALFKKGYYEDFSEVSSFNLVGDLFHYYSPSTLVAYIHPEEKQEFDRFLLIYPSSIQLTSISHYSGANYDFLPIGLPFCFLLKSGASSFDLKHTIIQHIIRPLGIDCQQIGNHIIEWDSLCKRVVKKSRTSYTLDFTPTHSEPDGFTKSTADHYYGYGLPGGSLDEESDTTVIFSEDDICPELSYLNEGESMEDWQACEPHLPILCKSYSSCDWKSSIILCNSSTPVQHRLYSSRACLYLLVSATITPNLRIAAESSSTDNYFDSKEDAQHELCSNPLFSKLSIPLHPVDFAKTERVPNDTQNLHTCFQLFSKRNHLDEQNQWYCPHCQQHVCAENRTFIEKLPDVLVLQLERFEFLQAYGYNSYSSRRKITSLIDFPIHGLDMNEWMYNKNSLPEDCIYDLKAICNHSGSSSGGHYFCFACDENQGKEVWNEYNDSSVYPMQADALVKDTAYVLFYQRRRSNKSTKHIIEEFRSMIETTNDAIDELVPSLQRSPILLSTENSQIITDPSTNTILVSDDNIDSLYNYSCLLFHKGMALISDTIGISFGYSSIAVSYLQNDNVYVLSSADGTDHFPFIITFDSDNIQCCNNAFSKMHPETTIKNVLCVLGKNKYSEEIQRIENSLTIPVTENSEGIICFFIENCKHDYWTVNDLLIHICCYLKNQLESVIKKTISQCIISVPDSLGNSETEQLKLCVEMSGMNVLRLEKASVCMGYYIANEAHMNENLMEWINMFTFLFDMDETELSISIIDFIEDKPHIVSTTSTAAISGERIIQKMIKYIERMVNTEYGVDLFCGLSGRNWQREYSRMYKEIGEQLVFLTQVDTIYVELPAACQRWIRRNRKITIEEVEIKERDVLTILKEITDLISQTINTCLVRNEVHQDGVFRVVPLGQLSYYTFINNMLIRFFGNEKIYKGHYRTSCVAYGIGELLK